MVAITEISEAIAAIRWVTPEILSHRKDGTTFWNGLFISLVFNQRGELIYFFASQLDINRRQDAEEA